MSRLAEVLRTLTGERRLPKSVRNTLAKHGDKKIIGIEINRDPLSKGARTFADLLSLGKFSEAQKKAGFDKFFHLYAIIILEDNTELLYEKNQNVVLYPGRPARNPENENIMQGVDGIPLAEFIQKHIDRMGFDKYLRYTPLELNCQNFLSNALKANGLPSHDDFIMQNLGELVKEIPSWSQWLAQKATDLAGAATDLYEEAVYKKGGNILSSRRPSYSSRRVGMF